MVTLIIFILLALAVYFLLPRIANNIFIDKKRRDFTPSEARFCKIGCSVVAGLFLIIGIVNTSCVIIPSDKVGHLKRVYGGGSMKPGQVIAFNGENGPQARTLAPGFHFELFIDILNKQEMGDIITVPDDHYGLVEAMDGRPLEAGQLLAKGFPEDEFQKMISNAELFLKKGGQRGTQLNVLKPGKYRLNTYLFKVTINKATNIEKGYVGVVKSNVQENPVCDDIEIVDSDALSVPLVKKGCVGVWNEPIYPGKYYLNHRAYSVTLIPTTAQSWEYKGGYTKRVIDLTVGADGNIKQTVNEESVETPDTAVGPAITARIEGWIVPLDVRAIVQVDPKNAPFVVASVGGLKEIERVILRPSIRSHIRTVTGASGRKVLELQDNREELEILIEQKIKPEGLKAGVAIKEILLGDPAIPPELLTARQREQLAGQLKETYTKEKLAQDERVKKEKSKAQADQQSDLVKAEMKVLIAEQNKMAMKKAGEGEKEYLTQVAKGQQAQVKVLGKNRVMQLNVLDKVLEAAKIQPEIVKVPNVLVQGSTGGLEGSAAILGANNLMDALNSNKSQEK
jgi:hypothetical protein